MVQLVMNVLIILVIPLPVPVREVVPVINVRMVIVILATLVPKTLQPPAMSGMAVPGPLPPALIIAASREIIVPQFIKSKLPTTVVILPVHAIPLPLLVLVTAQLALEERIVVVKVVFVLINAAMV